MSHLEEALITLSSLSLSCDYENDLKAGHANGIPTVVIDPTEKSSKSPLTRSSDSQWSSVQMFVTVSSSGSYGLSSSDSIVTLKRTSGRNVTHFGSELRTTRSTDLRSSDIRGSEQKSPNASSPNLLSPGLRSSDPTPLSGSTTPLMSPRSLSPALSLPSFQLKIIIWDFDRTITRIHTCGYTCLDHIPLSDIIADIDVFRNVSLCLRRAGFIQGVASYGTRAIITSTLNRLFAGYENPLSDNIITPSDISPSWREGYEPPAGFGKWMMLDILRTKHEADPEECILIDDSLTNCMDARSRRYRTRIVEFFGRKDGFPFPGASIDEIAGDSFLDQWNAFIGR